MTKYLLVIKPNMVPLGLQLRTKEESRKAIAWQTVGGFEDSDLVLCEVRNGKVYSPEGEVISLANNGVFTKEAWAEFITDLEKGDLI